MKIIIDERAQKWFEEEIGIPEGSGVRFLGKVYGSSPLHEGSHLALSWTNQTILLRLQH